MAPVDDALDRLADEYVGRILSEDEFVMADRALATVREELQRLREVRDGHPDAWSERAFDQQKARAEAAEAEVQRLTEGLREIDKLDGRYHDLNTARWMARKTLDAASPDGANTEAAPNEVPADWGALDEGDVISLRVFDPRWGWEREHRTVTRVFSDGSVSFLDRDTNREYTVERDDKDWLDRSPLFVSRGANTEGGEA